MVNLWLAAVVEAGILPRREFACKVRLLLFDVFIFIYNTFFLWSLSVFSLFWTFLCLLFHREKVCQLYIFTHTYSFPTLFENNIIKINKYDTHNTYTNRLFSPPMHQQTAPTVTSTVRPAICTGLPGPNTAAAVRIAWVCSITTARGQVRESRREMEMESGRESRRETLKDGVWGCMFEWERDVDIQRETVCVCVWVCVWACVL